MAILYAALPARAAAVNHLSFYLKHIDLPVYILIIPHYCRFKARLAISFATAANSSRLSVSALRFGSMPAASSASAISGFGRPLTPVSEFRSVLRRWPKPPFTVSKNIF